VSVINQFCAADFSDEMLPVSRNKSRIIPTDESFSSIVNKVFGSWTGPARESFCKAQWQFLAPVFRKCTFQYNIHRLCPMPIVERLSKSGHSTQFSEVEEWIIHQDHLDTDTVRISGKSNPPRRQLTGVRSFHSRMDTLALQ
jgi:hypothetical protein